MTLLLQIVLGVFILGVLVFIHELGHFLAAKSFGIRVLTFSLGFGKILLKKTYKGTEYRISAIPFGGFIHMAGEHPDDVREKKPDEFTSKPIWQRICVAIAGPAANIISSVFFLWWMYVAGVQQDIYLDKTIVGDVASESPALMAGMLPGDSIISMNNKPVGDWEQIIQLFSFSGTKIYDFILSTWRGKNRLINDT